MSKSRFKLTNIPFGIRALAAVLVLTLALSFMVAERIKILTKGAEVILKTKPVDPRDFFRGHYARLNFDISRVKKPDQKTTPLSKNNATIFVRLKADSDGFWQAVSVHNTKPPQQPGTVIIRGKSKYTYSDTLFVRYGIERYFAPKAKAINLENLDRKETQISIIARISNSGEAAISGLMIDGKRIYEEPLF